MTDPSAVARVLEGIPDELPGDRRFVIALAGPPAAGKTTLADDLRQALEPTAAVLGLDAFHFDDAILEKRGHRSRKGAPHTFDVDGYQRVLRTLRAEPNIDVAVPVFDRVRELSRGSAKLITADHAIVITEGNYLLLEEPPWSALRPFFDLTVMVSADMTTVEERILKRWADHGLSRAEARKRFDSNDGPNAQLVVEYSSGAQIRL